MNLSGLGERVRRWTGGRFRGGARAIPPERVTLSNRGHKIAIFSRQLSSMMAGGVPLVRCLDVLAEQNEDPKLGDVLNDVANKLGQGYAFSKSLSRYPRIFPPVMIHLVATGENTGQLVKVVARLADLLETEDHLLKQVRGALSYPLFIVVLSGFLSVGLFTTVLPSFASFYKDFDVELPAITKTLMMITAMLTSVWFWLLSIPLVYGLYRFIVWSWGQDQYRLLIYRALTAIPLCGTIWSLSCLTRYCWVMELTQEAGVDMMRSLRLAGNASGAPTVEVDASRLVRGITEGETVSDMMSLRMEIYPSLLVQMVMMGEESSRYSESYGRSADWFAQDVEGRVASLQAALEPVMMGGIAFFVGGIILAVFLPLYGLLDKLGI